MTSRVILLLSHLDATSRLRDRSRRALLALQEQLGSVSIDSINSAQLKFSLGNSWGDQGYIRVARGNNTCAIATVVLQIDYKTTSGARSFDLTFLYLAISYFVLRVVSSLT